MHKIRYGLHMYTHFLFVFYCPQSIQKCFKKHRLSYFEIHTFLYLSYRRPIGKHLTILKKIINSMSFVTSPPVIATDGFREYSFEHLTCTSLGHTFVLYTETFKTCFVILTYYQRCLKIDHLSRYALPHTMAIASVIVVNVNNLH